MQNSLWIFFLNLVCNGAFRLLVILCGLLLFPCLREQSVTQKKIGHGSPYSPQDPWPYKRSKFQDEISSLLSCPLQIFQIILCQTQPRSQNFFLAFWIYDGAFLFFWSAVTLSKSTKEPLGTRMFLSSQGRRKHCGNAGYCRSAFFLSRFLK